MKQNQRDLPSDLNGGLTLDLWWSSNALSALPLVHLQHRSLTLTYMLMKKTLLLLSAVGLFFSGSLVDAQAIIVDDSSNGFTASTNWLFGTGPGGYLGTYRYRVTGPVADPATWTTSLKVAGVYQIHAIWASGANRTTTAPYIVYHAGGTTTVYKNQQVNGGLWNLLGTFNLNAGANQVKLTPWTTTGSIIVADAIRWQ